MTTDHLYKCKALLLYFSLFNIKTLKNALTSSISHSVRVTNELIPNPRRWKALGLLSLAQFLVILDTSIIGVALPTIHGYSQSEVLRNVYVLNAFPLPSKVLESGPK